MNLRAADRIVKTLLYEGYILYPYRASSVKNRMRFNFGVVYPKAYSEAQNGNDAWTMQTECLAKSGGLVEICVRFLRLVGETWHEAVECSVTLPPSILDFPVWHQFSEPGIEGVIEASADSLPGGISRIRVKIRNLSDCAAKDREAALSHSLVSAHTILGIEGGEFISLLDPPAEFRDDAAACKNEGTYPVLIGAAGQTDTVLSSPIILYDYPALAPESPGDLCDATEIDEILTLRILTLTEDEKAEARRTDERARRILDRAEALGPEQFARLHGTFRGVQRVIAPGSRVRLRPRKGGDIFDIALAGQIAIVQSLEEDFEGRRHVAVVLEDDPGRDLGEMGQPGHRFFFAPEEMEPV